MQGTTAPQQRLGKVQADIQAANYETSVGYIQFNIHP
jgi:hypothetical protein